MTIQSTKKLQDFIGIKTDTIPTDEESINLWHGNIFMIGRRKCLLLTHNESYYSLFIYGITKKDIKELSKIIKKQLAELLRKDNFSLEQIVKMTETVETIEYSKTSDRKVMGVMKEMVQMLKYYNMTEDELALSVRLNHTLYKREEYVYAVDELKSFLDDLPSDRLQTAIDEVKRGDMVQYDSIEDMMKDLKA